MEWAAPHTGCAVGEPGAEAWRLVNPRPPQTGLGLQEASCLGPTWHAACNLLRCREPAGGGRITPCAPAWPSSGAEYEENLSLRYLAAAVESRASREPRPFGDDARRDAVIGSGSWPRSRSWWASRCPFSSARRSCSSGHRPP